ncbi:peptide/nickel transport system permease protein [Klenkia marina]|uniref:Peptide/nickel transport system permease protein n=1 Tax=Klenkia marina TaxID=1960309 RepID=A0A1G4YLN8_9ACTN|nr:ABC transporter permease subunit [Klenkia marina]SCX54314.1 peptide/nickel transport system permease protein [Klenkia marina]
MRRLRSALAVVGTALGVVLLLAALPWLRGEDPAVTVFRALYAERTRDPAVVEDLRRQLDLPDGPVAGAWQWLTRAVRGDLGTSWVDRTPVAPEVLRAVGVSAGLAGAAVVVALAVAVVLLVPATTAAVRRGRPPGGWARGVPTVLAAVPEVVLGVVLLAVVAVQWRWTPTSGWGSPGQVVLPALALGVPSGGLLARVLGTTVTGALAEPWVRTARINGAGTAAVTRSVLRRAVAVAAPQVALLGVGVLGSAVAVEQLFAVPGAGRTALRAVLALDLPLLQGCVLALVLLGLLVGLAGGLTHRWLLRGTAGAGELPMPVPVEARRTAVPLLTAGLLLAVVLVGSLRGGGEVVLADRLAAPGWTHPLGADAVGRDVLARFAAGALLTVGTGAAVTALATALALLVAATARDTRPGVPDVLNALPGVLVGVVLVAVTGPGLVPAALGVLAVAWVPLAVHGRTLVVQGLEGAPVRAAVLAGAGRWVALRDHVLPGVVGPLARHALARVPSVSLALAALSFLGLGAATDSPEWGAMLAEGLPYLQRAPWVAAAPVVGLLLLGLVAGTATAPRRR